MSLNNPDGGFGYAAEFQSSALPFVTSSSAPSITGSSMRIDFPKITRFITLVNHSAVGNHLCVGFTKNGMSVNPASYFTIDGGQIVTLELRVTSIYLAGSGLAANFALCAGLTNISARQMPILSGTLPNGDPGWLGVG